MTIAAESFVGRVLAVLSRRSPGFRSPLTPAGQTVSRGKSAVSSITKNPEASGPLDTLQAGTGSGGETELNLTDATAWWWKSALPHARLQQRGNLKELADHLVVAEWSFEALIQDRTRDRELALNLDFALARARALALGLDLALALTLDHELSVVFDCDLLRDRELDVDRSLDRELQRVLECDRARAFDHIRALIPVLISAYENLMAAADNFIGADVAAVDLGKMNLAGVRWDSDTRWPSREWADRVLKASEEEPPGSGIFTVRSEGDYEPAAPALV